MSDPKTPRFFEELCLEWLYRLVRDPRRPWTFLRLLWREWQKRRADVTDSTKAQPSRLAEKLLYLVLSKEQREHLPGDLEQEFKTIILPKFGPRYAKFWHWWQVIRTIIDTSRWAARFLGYGGGLAGVHKIVSTLQKWGIVDSDKTKPEEKLKDR